MTIKKLPGIALAALLAVVAGPALAQEPGGGSAADPKGSHSEEHKGSHSGEHQGSHSGHMELVPGQTEASGVGVINAVDPDKGVVNLTHEPMPDLGWPEMTMDLPVTKKVDLTAVKAGDKVGFTLKLGRDKVYRITDLAPTQ